MLNFGFIILLSIVLVYLNIIILNEETLILICFIMFCVLAFNKLSKSISEDFATDSHKIENILYESLDELIQKLNNILKYQSIFLNITHNFYLLKTHFINFGVVTTKELPKYIIKNTETIYPKKLMYTQRLENQTSKLLALLLNYKLNKITNIQNFYTYNLKVTNFLCINKVILREYLKTI